MTTYSKETALYNSGAIASDINEAGTKASKYITSIGDYGIKVHPYNDTTRTEDLYNYAKIDSSGMEIYKNIDDSPVKVASFGENVQIGMSGEGNSRMFLAPDSLQLISPSQVETLSISNSGHTASQTILVDRFNYDVGAPNTTKTYSLDLEDYDEFTVEFSSRIASGDVSFLVSESIVTFAKNTSLSKTFSIKFVKTGTPLSATKTYETINGTVAFDSTTSEITVTAPNFVLQPGNNSYNHFVFDSVSYKDIVPVPTALLSGLTYLSLDTTGGSGLIDDDLYSHINGFGWANNVIE